MPSKSKSQMRYIYAMRNKYKTKKNAPKNMKWVFNKEWTSGVKMKKLPENLRESYHILKFDEFII